MTGWSLAWSDEFDGAVGLAVDSAVWWPEIGGHGWGNRELQYYTDGTENAALDGAGNLAITVRRTDARERRTRFDGCEYTYGQAVSTTLRGIQTRVRPGSGPPASSSAWPRGAVNLR